MFESKRFWMISTFSLLGLNVIIIGLVLFMILNKPKPREPEPIDPVFQIGRRLDLSPEQRELMRDSMEMNWRRDSQIELFALRNKLLSEARSDNPDSIHIDSLISQIGQIHANMERHNFKGIKRLKEISNPKQKEKLNKMIERMENGFEKKMKRQKRKSTRSDD